MSLALQADLLVYEDFGDSSVRVVGQCVVWVGKKRGPYVQNSPTWNGEWVGEVVAVCGTAQCVRASHLEFRWRLATDYEFDQRYGPRYVGLLSTIETPPEPTPDPTPPAVQVPRPAVPKPSPLPQRPLSGGTANREKTHCPAGHPYDEANTRFTTTGRRVCKACESERQKLKAAGTWTGMPNGQKTHCPEGHPYDMKDEKGYRRCSTCRRAQLRARRHRDRATNAA